MRIRTRLSLSYGAALASIVVVLGALVWLATGSILRGSLEEALRIQAADVRAGMVRDLRVAVTSLDPAQPGVFTGIYAADGALRLHSRDFPAMVGRPPDGTTTEQLPDGDQVLLLSATAPDRQTVVVGSSLGPLDRELAWLAVALVAIGSVGIAASMVGGWLLSARALAPVARLTTEANAIGANDLDRRLPQPAQLDEIGRLAQTLNGMLERVAAAVRRERAFVTAASHDLRSPIAALRTELELIERVPADRDQIDAAVRAAHADAVRLSQLASDLLGLAESEASGRALAPRPVRVSEVVDAALATVRPLAAEKEIRIARRVADLTVDVDRVRVEQALTNLLANAIREAPAGSTVEVESNLERAEGAPITEGGRLAVSVLDRGPGVASAARPNLFVPFASRARGRDGGTGLGLATAAAAVHAHGGTIEYADRPGGGAAFTLRLPLEQLRAG